MSYEELVNDWMAFYLTFNDDNVRHATNAFDSHNYADNMTLFEANEAWVRECREHGITDEEILSLVPNAKKYM